MMAGVRGWWAGAFAKTPPGVAVLNGNATKINDVARGRVGRDDGKQVTIAGELRLLRAGNERFRRDRRRTQMSCNCTGGEAS